MGRKGIKNTIPKIVAFGLAACIGLTTIGTSDIKADQSGDKTSGNSTYEGDYSSERLSSNYTQISSKYTLKEYKGEQVVTKIDENISDMGTAELTSDKKEYTGSNKVLDMELGDTVSVTVKAPEDGQYFVLFNYLSYDESILPIEVSLQVDGKYPFYECRNLEFETYYAKDEEASYDRYDNEVVTIPNKLIRWEEKYLMDSSYRHSEPLALELTAGEHVFTFEVNEGNFLFGNITLVAPFEVDEYKGSETAPGKEIITIQGEDIFEANDSSIHGICEFDTSVYPYKAVDTVLNTLDSGSFDVAGQMVTYQFKVEKAGYYYIGMNYRQSDKTDFQVFLDVLVDGKIPNTAFQSYGMNYTTKYKVSTLKDSDGKNLSVYLEEGLHTISFRINQDIIREVMEQLDVIMAGINDLSLEITKVAGTNSDKYRDLQLSKYIPNLEKTLYGYADKLEALEKSMLPYSSSKKNVAVMSSVIIAAEQLRSLADEPDEIPYRIGELSTSANSANRYLANTIDSLIRNNIAIDRIYIYQEDATVPKAPGFFKSLWMNITRFIASFTDQAYSTSNTDPEHLQVWVSRSTQYVEVMQKMIDEQFTPATGIKVDISIMPDQYKLVLSNASGSAPDVATGINYTVPYELAIRGALVDMTQFEDFKTVAADYEPGFFLTGTIGDSVYSMPETMNFWVLFYRSDVLDKLGLEVPETMDEVIDILPELQMRGLDFYYPASGMLAMRNFHGTTPLVVQNGGALYYDTAELGTALGEEAAIKGFTQLTDLFTIYDMPINIDNFYQHFRNGDMPIGIADYNMYNMLTNAAPELDGSWEIALAPGTIQEDGSINYATCGCAESTVIFKSDAAREAKAWEFTKWWSSAEVQAEFGQTMQITYGDEYMWPTANTKAFAKLPWDTDSKEVIADFMKNVVDVARIPGTYLLEREMSNAFNDIVVNGDNEQTRIDKAVKVINREIERKLEEFGYIDSEGNVLKEYRIPTIESVKKILGRD